MMTCFSEKMVISYSCIRGSCPICTENFEWYLLVRYTTCSSREKFKFLESCYRIFSNWCEDILPKKMVPFQVDYFCISEKKKVSGTLFFSVASKYAICSYIVHNGVKHVVELYLKFEYRISSYSFLSWIVSATNILFIR